MDKINIAKFSSVNISKQDSNHNATTTATNVKFGDSKDEFTINATKDAANDGKFSVKEAFKNFGKGIISPIITMFKHPIATIATVAGIGFACFAVPVLTPVLTVGFGALSLYHLGKATINTIKDYKNGNYDNAEKGFKGIAEGIVGTITSMLGLKSSAKIAAEARAIANTGSKALDATTKNEIALQVSKGGFKGAIKEHFNLFFTKNGLKSIAHQFKPSVLKERFATFRAAIKEMKEPKKSTDNSPEAAIEKFKKSPEGIRRAKLTDEQLKLEIQKKYNQAFDELGIPKDQRPTLKIESADAEHAGSYSHYEHTLRVNPESYKSGLIELDDVLMHEATHCKESLLRAGLPKERAEQIVKENLIARISGGENEKIILKGSILGPEVISPPKLTPGMQKDFTVLAKKHLYTTDSVFCKNFNEYIHAKSMLKFKTSDKLKAGKLEVVKTTGAKIKTLLDDLHTLVDKHPDFVKAYKTREEAIAALEQYALSHNSRYRIFSNNAINGVTPQSLTPEQMKLAEKSLNNYVDTMEGNAANQALLGIISDKKRFNQYQFSPEEVLSQQNGNNFLIKNCKAKLAELKKNGTLTPEKEAYLTATIKKAEATIAYKTKGSEYYEFYRKLANNPADTALKAKVGELAKELHAIESALHPEDVAAIQGFIMQTVGLPQNSWPAIAMLEK